jgi:hypothetical protein
MKWYEKYAMRVNMTLRQEGARGPHPAREVYFFSFDFAFLTGCGLRDTNKGAMWPANENSCPPLL